MIISSIEIAKQDVTFYFADDDTVQPWSSYEFKAGTKARKQLDKLTDQILIWNSKQLAPVIKIHVTSAGCIFYRCRSIPYKPLKRYAQWKLIDMERIIKRWNRRNA